MSSQGNAGGGGAEDPEATEVDDLGVDAREAGGAHGAEGLPVQVAAVGRLHLQRRERGLCYVNYILLLTTYYCIPLTEVNQVVISSVAS